MAAMSNTFVPTLATAIKVGPSSICRNHDVNRCGGFTSTLQRGSGSSAAAVISGLAIGCRAKRRATALAAHHRRPSSKLHPVPCLGGVFGAMAPPLKEQFQTKMEAAMKFKADLESDMQTQLLPWLESMEKDLDRLEMKDLSDLRARKKISEDDKTILDMVYFVLEEKEMSGTSRPMVYDHKFVSRLKCYERDEVNDVVVEKLTSFFSKPEPVGELAVPKAVLTWMRGIYEYSTGRKKMQSRIDEVRKMDKELHELQQKIEKEEGFLLLPRHWFPIASTLELDPKRPTPVRLDGLDLVVWQVPGQEDAEDGGWRVMSDACPHRLAPLSEGRIEPKTKCLQCAYHGWEFDSGGGCTKIPQVEEAAAEKMRKSERSQVASFPTKIAMKLLWVWLGDGEPRGHPKDILKGSHLESEFEVTGTYTRDLPYGYDSLIENLIDVSHVPFAHHGLQGTRDDAVPVSMTIPEVKTSDTHGEILSFTFWDRTMGMRREAQFSLRSPFFFFYLGEFKGDGDNLEFKKFSERRGGSEPDGKPRFRLHCACVPVAPGWSRLILCNAAREGKSTGFLPPWAIHLLSNRFLDSDMAFLHYQERKLRNKPNSAETWSNAYYMPGTSNQPVTNLQSVVSTKKSQANQIGVLELGDNGWRRKKLVVWTRRWSCHPHPYPERSC
eukprot:symbB.v1.2.025519.t1/scaffold2480.1/size78183/1